MSCVHTGIDETHNNAVAPAHPMCLDNPQVLNVPLPLRFNPDHEG